MIQLRVPNFYIYVRLNLPLAFFPELLEYFTRIITRYGNSPALRYQYSSRGVNFSVFVCKNLLILYEAILYRAVILELFLKNVWQR